MAEKKSTNAKSDRKSGWYYAYEKAYVGVTTVLNVIDKSNALIPWACKIVAKASRDFPDMSIEELCAQPNKQKEIAGKRGTLVHSLAETISRGNKPDISSVPEDWRGYAEALVKFFALCVKKVMACEFTVYNNAEGYAGTGDLIFEGHDGKHYIADFKTGKYIYKTTGLQLSAYQHGDYIEDNVTKARTQIPKIDERVCVLLKPDGTFATETFLDGYEQFKATLKMYRWLFVDDVKHAVSLLKGVEK